MKKSVESKAGSENDFAVFCRRAGIKATQQRRELYREVLHARNHPDAARLYRKLKPGMPALSLDTVYRNLHILEKKGILRRVASTGPTARYDINLVEHHHFFCNRCFAIHDFSSSAFDAVRAPAEALQHGQVQSLQIAVNGICKRCLKAGQSARGIQG